MNGSRSSSLTVTFDNSDFTGSFADGSNGLWNVSGLSYTNANNEETSLNGNYYGAAANWGSSAAFSGDSVWTVTNDSYLGSLTIADNAKITGADGADVVMYVNGEETEIKTGEYSGEIVIKVNGGSNMDSAIVWAIENGVTAETVETFAPDTSCTRAQIVTFLWRNAGSPEPTTSVNPFTDVSENDYYYNAVLWAVENGITSGTTNTTFSPNETCTRAQAVTFLWRENGEPSAQGSTFSDVANDAYYAEAVAWAVENGITVGTSTTTFSPNNNCTRGQIVTFLYRYMG
jgi:hypothetical protein